MLRKWLGVLVLSVFLTGCGYGTGSVLPRHMKIHIQNFANQIDYSSANQRSVYLPLLEVDVKNAIVDRFLFDGHLRVAEEEEADLILKGELVGYDRTALRFTDNDDIEEYRVQVIVNIKMFNAERQEVAWEESGFVGEATYFLTGPNATSESAAVKEAIVDLARRVVERTVEDW
ncbi:MAG: LPS assembly lipoprotein LptE [Candidatus Omnitrophica bacterium]|nr:LPS assembly lipoprotein LptE [Candidatus Omnitrophota bacterium]